MRWSLALAVVSLEIAGCAHEQPPPVRATAIAQASAAPEELLAAPGAPAPSQALASRFETRRIGEDPSPSFAPPARSGALVDIDVKDADIHDVLRLIADVGKVNIVVGDSVAGRVTMRLRRVSWQRALDAVTATKGLAVTSDGELLIVRAAK